MPLTIHAYTNLDSLNEHIDINLIKSILETTMNSFFVYSCRAKLIFINNAEQSFKSVLL